MSLQLVFLGTGTSAGVPMIGCQCEVCTSHDPRDHRDRPSVMIVYANSQADPDQPAESDPFERRLLIDTSPELRQQMIRHAIDRIDGVLYTHAHADHIFGMDDLRRFNAMSGQALDIRAEAGVLTTLRSTFRYAFDASANVNQSFVPMLLPFEIKAFEPIPLHGATWTPLRLMHGRLPILGYRIDHHGASIAYCTDVSSIPPETWPHLEDLDVLVIDALRYRHHPTHMTVDQALDVIERVSPRRAYLTHIAHDIRHAELEPNLPEHVFIAFDGLTVSCRQG